MGSGSACVLASENHVGGLILMSPYTSIKKVAKELVGFLGGIITDRFRNIDII